MKLKPNTYYKEYFIDGFFDKSNGYYDYGVIYTDGTSVYEIAIKYSNKPLIKYRKKIQGVPLTIKEWEIGTDNFTTKVEEITEYDMITEILELL